MVYHRCHKNVDCHNASHGIAFIFHILRGHKLASDGRVFADVTINVGSNFILNIRDLNGYRHRLSGHVAHLIRVLEARYRGTTRQPNVRRFLQSLGVTYHPVGMDSDHAEEINTKEGYHRLPHHASLGR